MKVRRSIFRKSINIYKERASERARAGPKYSATSASYSSEVMDASVGYRKLSVSFATEPSMTGTRLKFPARMRSSGWPIIFYATIKYPAVVAVTCSYLSAVYVGHPGHVL